MEGFENVAKRGDITASKLILVEAQGEAILVTELAGKVIAFSNVCSHEDCDFMFDGSDGEGVLDGAEVTCECHDSRFSVLDGSVLNPPATEAIVIYAVKIDGDDVLVGPR
jgi:nitrite reductase/ring-hydroxylating ferredoxin subunit